MIIKNYEVEKVDLDKSNIILLYGENQGFKDEIVQKILKKKKLKEIVYYEKEVLNNLENFFNHITTKSFFEDEKVIIIRNVTDKIKNIIEELIQKNIEEVTILLETEILEKKSKLRNFFEKDKNLICIAFYPDDFKNLNYIAQKFFKEKKINISQQIVNLIIERSNGSRHHLKKELEKIENFSTNKKEIKINDIIKLTNLSENYDISELVESCLAKNQKKLIKIINENNFSNEDTILVIRTFLLKAKRLLSLKINYRMNKNLDSLISSYKPPIFWKEKPIIKEQLNFWSEEKLRNLIKEINEKELLIKKNINLAQNLLYDFILTNSKTVNN